MLEVKFHESVADELPKFALTVAKLIQFYFTALHFHETLDNRTAMW